MSKKSRVYNEQDLMALNHPRRAVTEKSPESFRKLGLFHMLSGFLAVFCQLTVTLLACYDLEKSIFTPESTNTSRNIAKASIGIMVGIIYWFFGVYGLYMGRHLYMWTYDVLKDRLWFFNVLSGLSIIISAALFGASSYLAKGSSIWYGANAPNALVALIMNIFLILISCFEVCVGVAGVFMK